MSSKASEQKSDAQHRNRERGQVDVRLIIGAIVLIFTTGPILTMGMKLQHGFAASPLFTPLEAFFVAGMLVIAVVAAILGLR